jgi:hypothetical protein
MALTFRLSNIGKPTPQEIEKAANSVLAGSLFIAGFSLLGSHNTLMLVWIHIGALAKIFSVFYGDDHVQST